MSFAVDRRDGIFASLWGARIRCALLWRSNLLGDSWSCVPVFVKRLVHLFLSDRWCCFGNSFSHQGTGICCIYLVTLLHTGSRGNVFVVRTSKPVENLWKNGFFWSRYSFRYIFYRSQTKRLRARKIGLQCPFFTRHFVPRSSFGRQPSVTLRATFRAPARIWHAVIDFQNGEQQSRSGQIRSEEIVYSRFIKIPLG